MKKIYNPYFLVIALITLITSCIKAKDFTKNELKWFSPYNQTRSIIFISEKDELDTIVFYKKIMKSDTTRSIDLGFYNTNYLTVPYKLTEGSYHQFALMSDGKKRYDQDIVNLYKSSSGNYNSIEITFLGMIFNGKEFQNIKKINESLYYFDSTRATYPSMDIETGKGIKNFTFSTKIGILIYTDDRNVKWKRK